MVIVMLNLSFYITVLYYGLRITLLYVTNRLSVITNYPHLDLLNLECRKVQYWAHCSFCFTSMIYPIHLHFSTSYYLQTTLMFFLLMAHINHYNYSELNKELVKVSDWFRANKLSLNLSKTNYVLFRSNRNLSLRRHVNLLSIILRFLK